MKGRPKSVVLRLEHGLESLGGLVNPQIAGPHLQDFSFSSSEYNLRISQVMWMLLVRDHTAV